MLGSVFKMRGKVALLMLVGGLLHRAWCPFSQSEPLSRTNTGL